MKNDKAYLENPKAAKAEFIKTVMNLAYHQSPAEVMNDFMDYALLMFRWDKTPKMFAGLEKKYDSPEQHIMFAKMLDAWSIASHNFHDAFGDIYMELQANERAGQFFTPQEVSDLMAMLSGPYEKGKAIMDCAVGSGRCLLSAAKIEREMYFFGADIDSRCCKMSVLNMLINTMEGEIAHMDSLSMKHWGSWHIGKDLQGNGHWMPWYLEVGPGYTNFLKPIHHVFKSKNYSEIIERVQHISSEPIINQEPEIKNQ